MYLTRHQTSHGPRWALNGAYLPRHFTLEMLLELPQPAITLLLQALPTTASADDPLLPPLEPMHEVWACGVTYLRSREAREAESQARDVYEKVYNAERPELFLKSIGWRVMGHGMPIRIRTDSRWNVPEPELTVVVNSHNEIVGYCVGNDVSSRDIEGENPLYLPQAKIYNGACAMGAGIRLAKAEQLQDLRIGVEIIRNQEIVFQDETRSSQMKRPPQELTAYLTREMDFPHGAFLMTGTGIVPEDDFSLQVGDIVRIDIDGMLLENTVES